MIITETSDSEMRNDLLTDDYASWTYDQATALIEHYNELYGYDDDVQHFWCSAEIRGVWSAYDNKEQAKKAYSLEASEDLEDYTIVLNSEDNTILIEDF